MAWIEDVEIENKPLSTTGGHTWAAAYRLASYLAAVAPDLGLDAPGARVLELGAGCGWLGITLARNCPAAGLVCLTEQEEGGACDWLRHNVELNRARGLHLNAVQVQPCDWLAYSDQGGEEREKRAAAEDRDREEGDGSNGAESPLDLETVDWDFIIGSDLIYNSIGSTCLPRVLAALARPATKIFYCHTKHRYDLLDMEFFEELTAVGLRWEEVWEPGEAVPPASPPPQFPPVDLFPEQRIAVFRIYKDV
jgi:predicted nicotinamide N-methyase